MLSKQFVEITFNFFRATPIPSEKQLNEASRGLLCLTNWNVDIISFNDEENVKRK